MALHAGYVNDGETRNQSIESWTGERKTEDFWGFTWPKLLNVNTVRYTTGDRSLRGGWFKDLTVQVRQGKDWVAVEGLSISPDYDHSPNVLGQKTFTLTFDDTVSDGVRIFGAPGGDDYYTSVAELGVYDE